MKSSFPYIILSLTTALLLVFTTLGAQTPTDSLGINKDFDLDEMINNFYSDSLSHDTVKAQSPYYQYLETDSSEHKPDSLSRQSTEIFYDSLQAKTSRNWITKELHDLFIKRSRKASIESFKRSEKFYKLFKGRKIRHIKLYKLDVFGPSLNDTLWTTDSWLVIAGNKFHINSSDASIKQNLLFREGDLLNPDLLADNERILRNLPNINDARIDVFPDFSKPDYVDIHVITKDVWSLKIDAHLNSTQHYNVTLEDANFWGSGNKLQTKISVYEGKEPTIGQAHSFTIENIAGTFVTGIGTFQKNYKRKQYGLEFYRRFLSPALKYGGGLSVYACENYIDSASTEIHDKFTVQDLWIGRSFEVTKQGQYKKRSRFVIAGRIINMQYTKRPIPD